MITVLAGVNGAGKSSITGRAIRDRGGQYFNPDEVARMLLDDDSSLTQHNANAEAWMMGYTQLQKAIANHDDYTFETTLGGNSITQCLLEAMSNGVPVHIYYCGLATVEQHIERVRHRVSQGGHDIPEADIRKRFKTSIHNMMRLLPHCHQTDVYDNSAPATNGKPNIIKLFQLKEGVMQQHIDNMPAWAKPLAAIAWTVHRRHHP